MSDNSGLRPLNNYSPGSYERFDDNLADILVDLLQGDSELLNRPEIQSLGVDNIRRALEWLSTTQLDDKYKQLITNEGWRLTYKRKPPTPEEFLTYDWIGPQAEGLWPNVKKAFIEYMDPNPLNPKRGLALSTSIGWGKDQPVSSNIVVRKNIELELEDGTCLSIPSWDEIEIIEKGETIKLKANDLLEKDFVNIKYAQSKIKKLGYSYEYKKLKDLKVGDYVLSTDGDKTAILNIQKNGVRDVYEIKLSDERSFRTSETHVSTVHFRNSPTRPDKKVYDVLSTKYIKDHLEKYNFEILTDDTFKLRDMDFIQHLEALPVHEYEPVDEEFIIPDLKKDPEKVYIKSIEKVGEEECWCLNLNDPMGLYVTEDGIITHNSLLTNLCMSYEIILFCLMHAPYKTLGHSPMTSYALTLASFSLGKVWDLLGTPFEQFIEQSPVFEKVARRDDVVNADKVDPTCSKILYSTAARGSTRMLFRNNLQLRMASSEGHLLGSAQPMYSKIMKPDGSYYTMGEVKVGDVIASPTEGSTVVTGIYSQGPRDIFEIELDDGRKVRASDNHLWKVAIDKNEQGEWNWQVVNTLQLIDWLSQDIEVEIYDEITSEELLKNL